MSWVCTWTSTEKAVINVMLEQAKKMSDEKGKVYR